MNLVEYLVLPENKEVLKRCKEASISKGPGANLKEFLIVKAGTT